MEPGIAILVLVLASFAALGGWALVSMFEYNLPSGAYKNYILEGIKIQVRTGYVSTDWIFHDIEKNCASALVTLRNTLKKHYHDNPNDLVIKKLYNKLDNLSDVYILLLPEKQFKKWVLENSLSQNTIAWTTSVPKKIGHGPPMIVAKLEFLGTNTLYNLIIHEGIHVLARDAGLSLNENHFHVYDLVWEPGIMSLEKFTKNVFFEK